MTVKATTKLLYSRDKQKNNTINRTPRYWKHKLTFGLALEQIPLKQASFPFLPQGVPSSTLFANSTNIRNPLAMQYNLHSLRPSEKKTDSSYSFIIVIKMKISETRKHMTVINLTG